MRTTSEIATETVDGPIGPACKVGAVRHLGRAPFATGKGLATMAVGNGRPQDHEESQGRAVTSGSMRLEVRLICRQPSPLLGDVTSATASTSAKTARVEVEGPTIGAT